MRLTTQQKSYHIPKEAYHTAKETYHTAKDSKRELYIQTWCLVYLSLVHLSLVWFSWYCTAREGYVHSDLVPRLLILALMIHAPSQALYVELEARGLAVVKAIPRAPHVCRLHVQGESDRRGREGGSVCVVCYARAFDCCIHTRACVPHARTRTRALAHPALRTRRPGG